MSKKIPLFFLILCLLIIKKVNSQTTYVSNGSSTNWSVATAWTPNGVPVIGGWPYDNVTINHSITYNGNLHNLNTSSIVINNGGTLTVTGNFTNGNWGLASLNVNSGGIFTVGGALTISGSDLFNNSGTINSGSFTLNGDGGNDVTNSGTINVTNDFIFDVARNFYSSAGSLNVGGTITLGPASSYFHISNSPIYVTGDFNVSGSASLASIGPSLTIGGNWNNTGAVATTLNAAIDIAGNLYNTGSSSIIFNGVSTIGGLVTGTGATNITANSTLQITGALSLSGSAYLNGSGTVSWGSFSTDGSGSSIICVDGTRYDTDPISPAQAPSSNSINLSACTLLPVELVYFNANTSDKEIMLHWQTAAEINSSHFIIERSKDKFSFAPIGELAGAGNSTVIMNYNFTDENPYPGENYYRLKQFDYDEVSEISNTIEVYFKNEISENSFNVYPTLILDHVIFSFLSENGEHFTIEIFDAIGNILNSLSITANKGLNILELSCADYSSGFYIARMTAFSERAKIKDIRLAYFFK